MTLPLVATNDELCRTRDDTDADAAGFVITKAAALARPAPNMVNQQTSMAVEGPGRCIKREWCVVVKDRRGGYKRRMRERERDGERQRGGVCRLGCSLLVCPSSFRTTQKDDESPDTARWDGRTGVRKRSKIALTSELMSTTLIDRSKTADKCPATIIANELKTNDDDDERSRFETKWNI